MAEDSVRQGTAMTEAVRSVNTSTIAKVVVGDPPCWRVKHRRISRAGCDAARYKIVSNARQYPTDCILTPLTYSKADGFATVLVPPLFR